jgi:hypothetical protein
MSRLLAIGSSKLREWRISDENLWTGREYLQQALAQSKCLDATVYADDIMNIGDRLVECEQKIGQEYIQLKMAALRERQSGDMRSARNNLERILRIIPDRRDERHMYARSTLDNL